MWRAATWRRGVSGRGWLAACARLMPCVRCICWMRGLTGPSPSRRCPISGCDEPAALVAAHLGRQGGWRTNHTEGILLRRDLHALLDAGKLEIIDGVVSVASEHYQQFNGVRVW